MDAFDFAKGIAGVVFALATGVRADAPLPVAVPPPVPEKTALELFSLESSYGTGSELHGFGRDLGQQGVLYSDFKYGHRFLMFGQVYLRAGLEYERWDFGRVRGPVPSKLQAISGTLAMEYVEQGVAGAAIELHPGWYFSDKMSAENFDIPWDIFVTVPLRDKKLYALLGASGAGFYSVPAVPIIGVIWLVTDKARAELTFPRTSLVYNASKEWEFRLVGELNGGGFRAGANPDPRLNRAVVEYYDYRVGAQATWSVTKKLDLVVGAGCIVERAFDFHRVGDTFRAGAAPYAKLSLQLEF